MLRNGRSEDRTATTCRLLRAIMDTTAGDGRIERNPCRVKGAGQLTAISTTAGSPTDSPFGGTEPATASPYTVVGTFSSPFDGQEVSGRKLPVQGSVEGFSSAGLVCIVRNDVFRYYPYSAQVADGRWSAEVGIGPVNIGRRFTFTLILATANQAAVDELSRRSEADYENGIQTLPAGIQQLTEVRIV